MLLIFSYSAKSAKIRHNPENGDVADVPCESKRVASNHVRAPSVFSTVFLKNQVALEPAPSS